MNAETARCLMAIQTELKAPKNQWNDFGKYKYRSCEDILEGVKQLLKNNATHTVKIEIYSFNYDGQIDLCEICEEELFEWLTGWKKL